MASDEQLQSLETRLARVEATLRTLLGGGAQALRLLNEKPPPEPEPTPVPPAMSSEPVFEEDGDGDDLPF